jgi:L-aspartate oxidase
VPPRETRAALWQKAGILRDPEHLQELAEDDPFPLARAIARSALARNESRGAHQRVDHPETDRMLDAKHSIVRGEAAASFRDWQ